MEEYNNWESPRTGEAIKIPQGVDPGFNHIPAFEVALANLEKTLDEKILVLPEDMQAPPEQRGR